MNLLYVQALYRLYSVDSRELYIKSRLYHGQQLLQTRKLGFSFVTFSSFSVC